ncbi:hypothetical protein CAOG_07639 [Capsaspora owczarzaki ATCC 30864]|uniref:hypothetical protein n=1 Tax=Capsaspora owczarzaki (strain ATCC 30864) TaxID=595528 RepID=UPI0001FE3041|nr:hypothetical protein CAOG_07639 [Capsaspora owczarzaki ATCC 30864]|eukprot:XP_004343513.1 hypothetical protein CAOG_07639 [Capsaspora owczarzaki ATCC 30864]
MSDIVVYYSEVSGNQQVKKNTQSLFFMFDGKKIAYKKVDVSIDDAGKNYMQSKSHKRDLPQVFVNGEFKGVYDDVVEANESGELEKFLS